MTDEELAALSPRRRAEALAAAGLVPEPRDPTPPPKRDERWCHADCGHPLDPVLVEQGWTLHPTCEPPKPDRRRKRR